MRATTLYTSTDWNRLEISLRVLVARPTYPPFFELTNCMSEVKYELPGVSMTLQKWVHDPFLLGNDPIFKGSWRPPGISCTLSKETRKQRTCMDRLRPLDLALDPPPNPLPPPQNSKITPVIQRLGGLADVISRPKLVEFARLSCGWLVCSDFWLAGWLPGWSRLRLG